jgi:hypothetical protein
MSRIVTFGLGGYCKDCDPSHDHPLHNIVEDVVVPDEPQQPLYGIALVATLNAVLGIWGLEDAANIAGVSQDDLIAEAQAWQVAGENNGN